jgi:hypothetical protein
LLDNMNINVIPIKTTDLLTVLIISYLRMHLCEH